MEVELGLDGVRALPLQAARGLAAAAGPGAVVRWRSVFLRRRNFLTASLFTRGRRTRWVASWSRAPWRKGAVLMQRWWRCSVSDVARGWRRARQREGRRRGAPCGADELGDAVEPVLVEVVDRAVAQEQLLVGVGLLGSFSLPVRAPDAVGRAAEPHALVPGRRLGAEVAEVEVLLELCRPWLAEGKAESGTVQRSLLRRG